MSQEQFYLIAAKILSGEASIEEQADFQRLVGSNASWQEEFRNMEEIWKSTSNFPETKNIDTEDAYLMHLARLKDSVQDFQDHDSQYQIQDDEDFRLYPVEKPWYRKWTSVAAGLTLIGLALGAYYWMPKQESSFAAVAKPNTEINVRKGAKTKLKLPDGSQVWVNSDSKLSYPESFTGKKREVYLEGEAYFDVTKDPEHPFIVHTSGIDIRVLGTAFNVKAYQAEPTIEATLVHGVIEVTNTRQPNAPKVILKHHEKLVFNKSAGNAEDPARTRENTPSNKEKPAITITQIATHTPDSAFLETAWVYNRLRFEDERFDNLMAQMERWFDVDIRIDNEKIKSIKLTGSFENETIEEALRELQYLVSFTYSIRNRTIVINNN